MLPWDDPGKVVGTAVGKTVDAVMADHLGGVTVLAKDPMTVVVEALGPAENDVVLQEVGHRRREITSGESHRNPRSFLLVTATDLISTDPELTTLLSPKDTCSVASRITALSLSTSRISIAKDATGRMELRCTLIHSREIQEMASWKMTSTGCLA